MATPDEIRKKIDTLINERGLNYRIVSMHLGRSESYIQQYITRGSPVELKEKDRKIVAALLGIDEQELTTTSMYSTFPAHMAGINVVADKIAGAVSSFFKKPHPDTVGIEMLDVSACCGTGIENINENVVGVWQMPLVDFKAVSQASPDKIKIVKAIGDSMQPTINDGDFVFIDIANQSMGSDGIYVLLSETGLSIKRLQNDFDGNITINSDNKLYNARTLPLKDIHILGRVINIVNLRKI